MKYENNENENNQANGVMASWRKRNTMAIKSAMNVKWQLNELAWAASACSRQMAQLYGNCNIEMSR
jgi:hypothetical protein